MKSANSLVLALALGLGLTSVGAFAAGAAHNQHEVSVDAKVLAAWIPDNTEQGGYEVYDSTNSKTRAQVLQELQEARQSKFWSTQQGEATGSWSKPTNRTGKTRAAVQQELRDLTLEEKASLRDLYAGA